MTGPRTAVRNLLVLPPRWGSFQRVAGLGVLQRTLLAAMRAGFVRMVVWAPTGSAEILELRREDNRLASLEVANEVPASSEAWAVVRSDWVVSPGVLNRLREGSAEGVQLLAAAGVPVGAVGSGEVLLAALAAGEEQFWSDRSLQRAAVRAIGSDEVAIPITSPAAIAEAEKALSRKIWLDTAETDGVLAHWVDRRLSLRMSCYLVRLRWLRPNHLTVFGTCLGLLAAYLFARGSYAAGCGGAVLFWVACVLDGCDGEVARLTYRDSAWGKVFDVTTDNVVHAAIFLGIGLGSLRAHPATVPLWLPGFLLGGLAFAGLASYVFLHRRPAVQLANGNAVQGQWFESALEGLMNRDFSYLLVVLGLVDRLHWFLWGAAIGSYMVGAMALVLAARANCRHEVPTRQSHPPWEEAPIWEDVGSRNRAPCVFDPSSEQ